MLGAAILLAVAVGLVYFLIKKGIVSASTVQTVEDAAKAEAAKAEAAAKAAIDKATGGKL